VKALVYHGPRDVRLEEVERPRPGPGEVLVRVKAALTCGTDLKAYRRGHPLMREGVIMGHEFSGIVEEIGQGVSTFRRGDRIACTNSAPCLFCRYCMLGRHNLCERLTEEALGFSRNGGYAEYVTVPERVLRLNAFHLPENTAFEEAAFLEPLSCAVHGQRMLGLSLGEAVLILGAGPVGLMHVQLCRLRGANPIIVADPHEEKLELARRLGADHTIDLAKEGLRERLEEVTNGRGVSAVIEAVGKVQAWEQAAEVVAKGGRVLLFGGCPRGTKASFDTYRIHYEEVALLGSFHYSPGDAKAAFELIVGGRVNLRPLISRSVGFEGLLSYFLEQGGGSIKVALTP